VAALRVLSVGYMYPPHALGGYEITWRSAVEAMRSRGHEVRVLAIDWRAPDGAAADDDADVHRELRVYWHEDGRPRLTSRERLAVERHNLAALERHVEGFGPDVVNWWPLGGMSLSALEWVRRRGLPVAGVVCDDWFRYCRDLDMWASRFGRRPALGVLAERLTGVPTRVDLGSGASWLFNSEAMRRRALEAHDLPETGVAHPGIETHRFGPGPGRVAFGWRLLYVGRIDARKGIDTAIRALPDLPDATLTVVGGGLGSHLAELRDLAGGLGVADRVSFERRPREQIPATYAEADALLFPVRWDEPWGLVPLEAMAVGTPVVATGTGGSGEYLEHERNCLLFDRDSPEALASAVARLAAEPELRRTLREGGLETAAAFPEEAYNRAIADAVERAARRPD
jgi:glycogen synthase